MYYDNGDLYEQCTKSLSDNIKLAEAQLGPYNSYAFYDLDLSEEEITSLANFESNGTALHELNYHFEANSTTSNLIVHLNKFFESVSINNSNTNSISSIVNKIFTSVNSLKSIDEVALLDLRITGYGIDEKWHTDNLLKDCQHRNIIALVGPSTLFYNSTAEIKDLRIKINDFDAIQHDSSPYGTPEGKEQMERIEKLNSLINESEIARPAFGQGALFYQGGENPALHAVPHELFNERIVVVIDVCNAQTYKEMQDKEIENERRFYKEHTSFIYPK